MQKADDDGRQPFALLSGDAENRTRVRKIRPRISTSLVGRCFSPAAPGPTGTSADQPMGWLVPLSRANRRGARHSGIYVAYSPRRRRVSGADVILQRGSGSRLAARPRAEEPRSQCGWHLKVALILRVRSLSACNPGTASSVEACHPHRSQLYHGEGNTLGAV